MPVARLRTKEVEGDEEIGPILSYLPFGGWRDTLASHSVEASHAHPSGEYGEHSSSSFEVARVWTKWIRIV